MKAISGTSILMALFIVSILLNVSADVTVADFSIASAYVLPANAAGGAQVFPVPGGSASASIYVIACKSSGSDKITQAVYEIRTPGGAVFDGSALNTVPEKDDVQAILEKAVSANLLTQSDMDSYLTKIFDEKVCRLYEKAFNLSYTDIAGVYTINATAYDADNNTAVKFGSFEYVSLSALEIDFSLLDFGEAKRGVETMISGDAVFDNISKPSIKNTGNVVSNILIMAGPMHATCWFDVVTSAFPTSSLRASIGGVKKTLSEESTLFDANLLPGTITSADFFLLAPETACCGNYYGKITIEGVAKPVITSTTTSTTAATSTSTTSSTTSTEWDP